MKSKNAIVALVRGYQHINGYQTLIQRNKFVYENIILKTEENFDFILFHEGNINNEHQSYISENLTGLNIIFVDVKNTEPKTAFDNFKNKINTKLCPPTPESMAFPLGYKHMCHFWSIDFLDYLSDYKYIIRIDEDCFITKFNENILQKMKNEEIYFSSPMFQEQDKPYVIVGLEKLWNNFLKIENFKPYKQFKDITCPYTNVMIVDVEYFLNNDLVYNFLTDVDDSHGIYSNRWGDLPIWGAILSTLIDKKHYYEDKKISYFHGSHRTNVNKI
jgi:hypothetical protein